MKTVVEHVVNYIEDAVHEKLSLETISREVGYSRFYLNRIFSVYTGMSIMEYARKRKLGYALKELKSDKRILDIAFDYGYTSERAFSRAFISEFGHSPSQCRKKTVCHQDKLIIYDIHIETKDGYEIMNYLSDVRYETLDSMWVIKGMKAGNEPEDEIINLFQQFKETQHIASNREFGFDVPLEEDSKEKGWRGYEFWISVNKDVIDKIFKDQDQYTFLDTPLTYVQVPSFRYVALRITDPFADPFERIPTGWKALVRWLEDNDAMKKAKGNADAFPCLEEVIEIDGVTYMDIFIPIG